MKKKTGKAKIVLPPVRIEKLVSGGMGLGFAGGAVFVSLTAPGDLVVPTGVRKAKGVFFAEPGVLLEPGLDRREPSCPWFGECGGCWWMHLDYPSQVKWKETISLEAFSRIGKLEEFQFNRVHPSPMETKYRHRARFHVDGGKVGFFKRGTNKVVEWDHCLLLPDRLNIAVRILRSLLRESPAPNGLKSVEGALSPVDGSLSFHWVFEGGNVPENGMREEMDLLESRLYSHSIRVAGQVLRNTAGKLLAARGGSLQLEIRGAELFASPGAFFQVNPAVNQILVDRALDCLKGRGVSRLLDLYCGIGNFSVPAALSGIRVDGVDSNPSAIRDARTADCRNCRFHAGDAGRFVDGEGKRWGAVLVDPPRTGLPSHLTGRLVTEPVDTLIYVSCEPGTLARDLAILVDGGYFVENAEIFDMFPQTPHAEILVIMGRRYVERHNSGEP